MLSDVKMEEIIYAFSNAVDVVNPILKNHHRRTAIIAYHLGRQCGLGSDALASLVVAASLHDIGALTIKDAAALAELDVHNPHPHERLGASMLSSYAAFNTTRNIILYHHVRYDEALYTDFEVAESDVSEAPRESFILHLADRIEILLDPSILALNQRERIVKQIEKLSGTLFDPNIVNAFIELSEREVFWFEIEDISLKTIFSRINMEGISAQNERQSLEDLVFTLSKVIDYKCAFTASHSVGVAYTAYRLAQYLGLSKARCREVKMAGYLHDIGKLAVPSEIISKPGKLTKQEFNIMKSHPYYTYQILKNIEGLVNVATWAGEHHEREDLSGYPRKPKVEALGIEAKIISYADVFTALCEDRPYRNALSLEEGLRVLKEEMNCSDEDLVYKTLVEHSQALYSVLRSIQSDAREVYLRSILMEN